MKNIEIIVAETVGFCSGVKKAISESEELLNQGLKIYCLGDIIHNKEVVRSLKEKGMNFISRIDELPENVPFIIRSHGLPIETITEIQKRHCRIYDLTCPRVKKSHKLVEYLKKSGKPIVIIGNKNHPEVAAIHSLSEKTSIIVENPEDARKKVKFHECYILVQSTFKPELFYETVKEIISLTKRATVYNTLCEETIRRQEEVKNLASKVDMIIVVGGKHSSNTKTLFSIASNLTKAVHIESADEIEPGLMQGIKKIAIVSGASTPYDEIEKIIKKIRNIEQSMK